MGGRGFKTKKRMAKDKLSTHFELSLDDLCDIANCVMIVIEKRREHEDVNNMFHDGEEELPTDSIRERLEVLYDRITNEIDNQSL
jgi:hypothetical protein